MITVLVVGRSDKDLPSLGSGHPSIELLTARGAEDALEKLARNRRIDAVLLLAGNHTGAIAEVIREEDSGAPPLFAPRSAGSAVGVRALTAEEPEELVGELIRALSADG